MSPLYCTSSILIRNGQVWKNGELILDKPESTATEFLRACYDLAAAPYPKFFKMDNLCKLAWVGAELLQQGTNFVNGYTPDEKGIILQNNASSLDTDIKHAESISSPDAYFPSPAVFVYTLPNITAGEICIRQQIKGSSAFFIFEAFDADFLYGQVSTYINSGRINACIIGIVEWLGNQYETCLFMVEKSADRGQKAELTTQFIHTAYTPS
jgi:hypothetical protein